MTRPNPTPIDAAKTTLGALRAAALGLSMCTCLPAMSTIDLNALWDFSSPATSEQRLRAAMSDARGDDRLILQTQIARSYGLRRDFDTARKLLAEIETPIRSAGPEARTRYQLELGRSYASATHPPASQTAEAKSAARAAFEAARAIAGENALDALAIDAIHMLAFVDTAPADQLKWAREALAVVSSSNQPAAKRWEASIRNNLGHALHQAGRYDEALAEFERALAIRQRGPNAEATRIARWMVAWTLRALERADQALAMQLALADECERAGKPDPHVFEELEILYRDRGDSARADEYARRRKALAP